MQLERLRAELPEQRLPYDIQVPHTATRVPLIRLACFTGARFTNAHSLQYTTAADQGGATKRARTVSGTASDDEHIDTPDGAGMCHLAAVVTGRAPPQLSVQDMVALTTSAAFCTAQPVLGLLPDYFAPLIAVAPLSEVCATSA